MDCPGIVSPTGQGIILKNKNKNNLKELLQGTQHNKIMWITCDTLTHMHIHPHTTHTHINPTFWYVSTSCKDPGTAPRSWTELLKKKHTQKRQYVFDSFRYFRDNSNQVKKTRTRYEVRINEVSNIYNLAKILKVACLHYNTFEECIIKFRLNLEFWY